MTNWDRSLLAWQRVRIASAIAGTGEEWWSTFKTAASGTYVNQYMVVNFNKFSPGKALPPGTLWVVEEIPGLVAGGDQTATLARGYWPSYNVPFYAEVYKTSGYPALDRLRRAERNGFDSVNSLTPSDNDGNLYDGGGPEYTIGAPRSKIFRRDEGKVVDLESFRTLLRYANYSDPYGEIRGVPLHRSVPTVWPLLSILHFSCLLVTAQPSAQMEAYLVAQPCVCAAILGKMANSTMAVPGMHLDACRICNCALSSE